jgi:hypothetical protein
MFYFVPPKQEAAAGVNAGDLILIRLEEKSQRRQFEIVRLDYSVQVQASR